MPPPFDPLDELLNRDGPVPDLPPHLLGRVRRRIAARATDAEKPWPARLEAVFARPSFAVLFVAACMLVGLFLAEVRLSRQQAARGAELARSYLQLVDPLLTDAPSSSPAPR